LLCNVAHGELQVSRNKLTRKNIIEKSVYAWEEEDDKNL
jgi:hypothetical protein